MRDFKAIILSFITTISSLALLFPSSPSLALENTFGVNSYIFSTQDSVKSPKEQIILQSFDQNGFVLVAKSCELLNDISYLKINLLKKILIPYHDPDIKTSDESGMHTLEYMQEINDYFDSLSISTCQCQSNACSVKVKTQKLIKLSSEMVRLFNDGFGNDILEGQNCSKLEKQWDHLKNYKQLRKEPITQSAAPECKCIDNYCRLNVSEVMPQLLHELNGVYLNYGQINCVDTAAFITGLQNKLLQPNSNSKLDPIFETNYLEIISSPAYKQSSKCKIRQNGKPKTGDIVLIKDIVNEGTYSSPKYNEWIKHVFVYISDDLGFHKPDSFGSIIGFIKPNQIQQNWKVKKDYMYLTPEKLSSHRENPNSDSFSIVYECEK